MSNRLNLRAALLLVALAFGLTLCVQVVLGGGSSAAEPAPKRAVATTQVSDGAVPDVTLAAAGTVPALREPRQPHKRRAKVRKPARKVVRRAPVRQVPVARPVPVVRATPAPTAAPTPRYVPPAPRYTPPKRVAPKPTPAPTSPPPSGEFDSSGEP